VIVANFPEFDSVAAVFSDERLSNALTLVHRQGHGHRARLIQNEGGDFARRLSASGIPAGVISAALVKTGLSVLVIEASHQTIPVAQLLNGAGAIQVEPFAAPSTASVLLTFQPSNSTRRNHRKLSLDAQNPLT